MSSKKRISRRVIAQRKYHLKWLIGIGLAMLSGFCGVYLWWMLSPLHSETTFKEFLMPHNDIPLKELALVVPVSMAEAPVTDTPPQPPKVIDSDKPEKQGETTDSFEGETTFKGKYLLFTGLFKDFLNAEKQKEELIAKGYPAQFLEVSKKDGKLIKVCIGGYENEAEAETQAKIARKKLNMAVVVQEQ